jgi:hypothetical protein
MEEETDNMIYYRWTSPRVDDQRFMDWKNNHIRLVLVYGVPDDADNDEVLILRSAWFEVSVG